MNFKKALFCVSFGLVGVAALSFSFLHTRVSPANALGDSHAQRNAAYDSNSFPGETQIGDHDLSVRASSSSKTSIGQSFSFYFSTGGNGYQDTTKTFVVAPNDSEFAPYFEEFNALTIEEKEEIEKEYDEGKYETKEFDGLLYSVLYQSGSPNVYIPKSLSRNIFFKFNIKEISTDAVTLAAIESGIKTITIPNSVLTVHENTFPEGLPEDFEFNVEFQASQIPSGWAANWNHGAKVNYGIGNPLGKDNVLIAGSSVEYGDKTKNYIIGYYPANGIQYPLVMSYRLRGSGEIRYFEFSKSTKSSIGSDYDAVGANLFGFSNSLDADISIDLSDNGEIEFESVIIHNIFPAKQITDETGKNYYLPDTDHPLYARPAKGYSATLDVTDLITYKFSGISTFGGYTSIDLNVDKAGDATYKKLKASFYKQYESNIASGKMAIRYRFTSLNSCSFKTIYNSGSGDVEKIVPISTPVNQHILDQQKGNFVSFLFKNSDMGKGFSAKSVRELSLVSFYVTLDLFDNTNGVVARSGITARFGYFMVMPYNANAEVFDINLMLILMSVGYVVAFAGLSVLAFFYFKNKYKNDEFKRIKPKSFWLKAILAMFGSLIVVLCITFIIIRSTAFNNAIVVFNPVDAYIIITVIASVLIIGYFIKYLVATTKANNTRKRNIKLKLNEDVADDGTK